MSKKNKNAVLDRDLRNPIKGQLYNDNEAPDRRKKLQNQPFMQLYKGVSFEFLKEKMKQNPKAMAVWWELVTLMDGQGSVMVSQPALATFFGVHRKTISGWITWLSDNDCISIFKVGTANVYAINTAIISDRLITDKQQFALFNARVIADKKEQTIKIRRKFFSVADAQGTDPAQQDLIEQIEEIKKKEKDEREEE